MLLYCDLKKEDLIFVKWDSEDVYVPAHYVAMDHASKSIVVAIRGTMAAADVFTDLIGNYEQFIVLHNASKYNC